MSYSQFARLVYIEPNDIPAKSGEVINNSMESLDNVTWQPEDYTYTVDLQVVVPDINDCGLVDYDGKYFNFSLNEGDSLGGEKNRYLTTDYVNISYTELRKNGQSSREFLGMNSINVNFNHYFFPEITINFTDVRGYSLMMPAEENYRQNLELTHNKKPKDFENLYQALFHFPYPKFYLTIKGFYGTRVTFELAVRDFKTAFNNETGGFDVTIDFIGYLYGLYTDIPMNYLLIAPYIDSQTGKNPGPYWKNNQNFKDTDGNSMQTFIEFVDNFARISEKISARQDDDKNRESIKQYNAIKNKLDIYISLRNCISSYFASISSSYGEIGRITTVNGNNYNAYFINGGSLGAIDIDVSSSIAADLEVAVNKLSDKYGIEIKMPTVGVTETDEGVISRFKALRIESSPLNTIRSLHLDDEMLKEIDSRNLINENTHVLILNHHNILPLIKDIINDLENALYEKAKDASQDITNIFEAELGFKPTLRNIFRMIFAHIDTFMHFMYNSTLKSISDESKSNTRIKVKDVKNNNIRVDIPKKNQNNENYSLPPFTGFYEFKNDKWEMFFPSRYGEIPEVKLVNNMVDSVLLTRNYVNDISKYLEKRELQSNNSQNSRYKMNFLPLIISDYYHYGTNPYDFLRFDKSNSAISIGEALYMAAYRIMIAYETRPLENTEQSLYNGLVGLYYGDYTIKDGIEQYAEIEAVNYYLHNKNIDSTTLSLFEGISTEDDLANRLKEYTDYVSGQTLSNVLIKEGTIQFVNNEHFIYFTQCYNNSGKLHKFPSNSDDSIDDIFYIFSSDERKRIESFINIDDIIGYTDDISIGPCYNNVNITANEAYFKGYYKCGGNLVYRLYKTNPSIPFQPKRYDKDDNEGKDYHTLVCELYDNETPSGFRFPGVAVDDLTNIFCPYKTGASAYIEKYTKASKESKAFLLLSAIPFGNIDLIVYNLAKVSTFSIIPKCALLYLGGWLYRRQLMSEGKGDLLIDCMATKDQWTKNEDCKYVPQREGKKIDGVTLKSINNLDKRIVNKLILYFRKWCESAQFISMWNALVKSDYVTSDGYQYPRTFSIAESQLIRFYAEPCYVINEIKAKKTNSLKLTVLLRFIKKLQSLYAKNKSTNDNTPKVSSSNVSEEIRLSIYRTLKTLNDKWLNSYTYNNFKLESPEKDNEDNIQRFENNEYNNELRREFNSFLFVDAFYSDIGNKMRVNPKVLYDMIMNALNAKENYSVYQFMADLCQKNKLLFITLPVYNNYYDSTTITEIFSVHPKYDVTKRIGNTYICMYAYEPSHVVNDNDMSGEYSNDGIVISDNNGKISLLEDSEAMQFALATDEEDLNITVPAFGVTYGRQNQSYFKSIEIGMDTPKTTDYGILNLFEIAKLGAKGFTDEPFAVGQDIYSVYSNRSYTCTVEMMGCMNIMPMMYFQLNNTPMFKGLYMIVNVSHTIVPGRITTKFTGVRVNCNQLPFNDDIFNVNTFIELIKEFGETHTVYLDALTNASVVGETNVAASKPITDKEAKENANTIKARLKAEFGWTNVQVAGVLGNIQQESMFNPKSINKSEKKNQSPKPKGNDQSNNPYNYGAGLIQWTFYNRKLRVLGYVGKGATELKNISIGTTEGGPGGIESCTLDEQITMLITELKTIFPNIVKAISRCKTAEESATTFYYRVERSPKNEDKIYRIAELKSQYDRMEATKRTANAKNYVNNES